MKTKLLYLLRVLLLKTLILFSTNLYGIHNSDLNFINNSDNDSISHYIGGNTESEYNYIYWQKIPSKNIKFYLLERSTSSNDHFTKIARISASSNRFMSFKDYYPKTTSYYRLLAFDSLGDFTIYNILSLDRSITKNQSFNLISTKDTHIFYISYKSETDEPIKLEIFKEGKKSIYQNTLIMTKGNNLIKLDLHFLSEGLYTIELHQNKYIYQQQFAMLSSR